MFRILTTAVVVVVLLLTLTSVGCAKRGGAEITPPDAMDDQADTRRATPAPSPPPPPAREEVDSGGFRGEEDRGKPFDQRSISVAELHERLGTIYFGFDSYDLSPTSLATLRENAEVLKAYPDFSVVVEGHCDERGTIEYNLALGEKRASAVRDYMTSLGLDRGRVRIITFGEERPVDPGHNESAWSKNRRAEFVVER